MDYSPEFIDFLKQGKPRELLRNKQFSELYEEVGQNDDLIPLLTKFSLEVLKINPLLYMDYVPYRFAKNIDIETFYIPDTIKSIGASAFLGCSNLTSVTIPKGVTAINRYTFYECESLISIEIPDGITSIGSHAFAGCTSLTNVVIPNSVRSIGDNAFYNCSSLQNIKYTGTIKQYKNIDKGVAWKYLSNLTKVICSNGVIEL
jgi:hypothetical protein